MTPEIITIVAGVIGSILTVGVAIAALIINSNRTVRAAIAADRKETREEISALRDAIVALRDRVARIEGLLEGYGRPAPTPDPAMP